MDATLKKQLEITATKVRLGIIEGVYNAKSGHPGGSLSIADLLTYLYFAKLKWVRLQATAMTMSEERRSRISLLRCSEPRKLMSDGR